ncbi:2-dehydropantoate 2-reductase [Mucilaginibacter sp. CSA2-8R]|uniref:ketopantoate reductase family protein n=1 Tax=Mucilaginibacter sp. CSA2-8R TaxID=3141542 RepID=UPI00315D56CA
MKYLVIGAGGTGGLIAGYLAKNQIDVTLIARGEHLQAIQNKGLTIKTYGEKPVCVTNIKAVPDNSIENLKFDVVFVCVKAYQLSSIMGILKNAAHQQTMIIPILNSLGAGNYLRSLLPNLDVYDGCIYITGYISGPGEVSQNNNIFKTYYGQDGQVSKADNLRKQMEQDVLHSGIKINYSSRVTNEIFRKLTFTSAFASCAAYYNKKAADLQLDGPYRQLFISLLKELKQISDAADLGLTENFYKDNLQILDSLSADFTTSLQKDLQLKKPDERSEIIFDIVRLAKKHVVHVPEYLRIAKHFGYV